jgi:5-methylcytosine-specific restriction endonuclease McrA
LAAWKHTRCGSVFLGKNPPFVCEVCAVGYSETGWELVARKPTRHQRRKEIERAKRKRRGTISSSKRERIYKRDGRRCMWCGRKDNLTIDHIVPLSKGGSNDDENLQTLCKSCNQDKADELPGTQVH